jgi:hypothetical protein
MMHLAGLHHVAPAPTATKNYMRIIIMLPINPIIIIIIIIIIITILCKPYLSASAPRLTLWGGGK